MAVKWKGLEEQINEVENLSQGIAKLGPHLEKALPNVEASIKRNFKEGGRPKKWEKKADGTPSHLTGRTRLLVAGINADVEKETIVVSSPRIYSSVHNNGEVITFKKRPISILMQQREFMIIPEDELEKSMRIITESIEATQN